MKGIDAEEVAARWELIKNEERARKPAKSQTDGIVSVMDDIPSSLPALDRARKLQKRAATVGFDWQTGMEVLAKLREEIDELEAEMLREDTQGIERELGDVLFTCVNLGRHVQSDPETALRSSNRRFETRFKRMERIAQEESLSLSEMSGEQLEALWRRVKAEAAASVK